MTDNRHDEALDAQQKHVLARGKERLGEGVPFTRTRRITGYLVGNLDRFNNAKRAEERDRVKHGAKAGEGE